MSDTNIAIRIEGDDTQAHAAAITSEDEAWVKDLSESGKTVRIRIPADADTEGHESSSVLTVLVGDEDDVEGHALSLHFPSVQEANHFRRNLMAAGLLTATLAVGAAGGAAIGTAASNAVSNDTTITMSEYAPNLGQYDAANMGGTAAAAAQQSVSQGQANPANMGGTVFTPEQAGQGNFNPANMGGTLAAGEQATTLGEASPANQGGTVFTPEQAGQGNYNAANPGGTPQSNANDEEGDGPTLPPGI